MKHKNFKIVVYIFSLFLLLLSLLLINNSYNPDNMAKASLKSDKYINVTQDAYIEFTPKTDIKNVGFIFYPGGKVEEESYAPLCKEIAKHGYKTIIVPMPFNLAILDSDEAMEVMKHHPNIKTWVIGGHSLGGAMASKFIYDKKPESIKGLIFYASYPAKVDLSRNDLKVLSIYGGKDNVLDISKLKDTRKLLPYETIYVEIEGANHAQFGNYGFQKGDLKADISRKEQQKISIEYTIKLLESIK